MAPKQSKLDLPSEAEDEDLGMVLNDQMGMMNFDVMFDGSTTHADDAIDFSDEDELADEELPSEHEGSNNKGEEELEEEQEDEDEDERENDENDDDLMNELQEEGMQGVSSNDAPDMITDGIFDNNLENLGNVGLQDLDFESNTLLDNGNEDISNFHIQDTKQVGESDIELSDDEELKKEIREKMKKQKLEREKKNKEKLLKIFYPSFKRGRTMKLQSLFPIVPLEFSYQQPPPVTKPLLPKTFQFELCPDSRREFRMTTKQIKEHNQRLQKKVTNSLPEPKFIEISDKELVKVNSGNEREKRSKDDLKSYEKNIVLSTADWNDDYIIEASVDEHLPPSKKLKVEDFALDDWEDDDEMIFDGTLNIELINLKLDMNDPKMVLMDEEKDLKIRNKAIKNLAQTPTNEKALELRFSISNDEEYEILKDNYQTKVRATIGTLTIDHTPPAIRLQSPYYKVRPSYASIRMYHRPRFIVRSNTTMLFSKPKTRKKKKDKGKEVSELFKHSSDLTLGDSANFFAFEYSEEFPLSMSKFGMGSKIINYYRKRNEEDTTRPKLSVGETHVLGVQDRSPFWNFGFVEKGNIVPTLYNQMIRAPVFHHDALSTDFLLVRSSGGGNPQRYFLRPINHLFTVGQTYPAVEVPGPHSRRITSITKNRLKMIVFRALNANEHNRLVVKDISEHFPDQSDMQNRQRLKEFMEYQRSGEDQGYWKIKSSEKLPDFEQTRRMISPEDICLMEMMLTGQLRFDDLDQFRRERLEDLQDNHNNSTSASTKKEKEGTMVSFGEETLSQQLAPWNTTRNFIQATQGKAMLQIHGEGDPSGKGEAFSFLKISMKGGFLKNVNEGKDLSVSASPTPKPEKKSAPSSAHSYNVAFQQKLYDEEIAKVWYKQQKSLSRYKNTDKPRNVQEVELKDEKDMNKANREVDKEVNEKPRCLKITRMVKNAYGIKERKVQIIKDPKVVEMYIKRKQAQILEDPTELESDALVLTNDKEENLKVKKRLEEELAKLQKQAEKKKKKAPGITAANIDSEGRISGKGIGKGKSTSRRCATCGALGHIRTNKTCPLYYTVHNKSNPNYIPGSEKAAELLRMNGASPVGKTNTNGPVPKAS